MLLNPYRPVPSGMSFDVDTGPTRMAYVLSMPGKKAVVGLTGQGIWAVDVLSSTDGVNFTSLGTLTMPGQWRYDTTTAVAIALRVSSYTSGSLVGTLAHGGVAPFTNVSSLLSSPVVFSFNSTAVEPPIGNQIRFNNTTIANVTKVWIRNTTVDGTDLYFALRRIPFGGTLLVQDRDDHTVAVLFRIVNPLVDKVDYIELPVIFQQATGVLASSMQVIIAAFNPGPTISIAPFPLAGSEVPVLQLLEDVLLPAPAELES